MGVLAVDWSFLCCPLCESVFADKKAETQIAVNSISFFLIQYSDVFMNIGMNSEGIVSFC